MTEPTNVKNVQERLKHLLEATNKFELAHAEIMSLLCDGSDIAEAETYRAEVMAKVIELQAEVEAWLEASDTQDKEESMISTQHLVSEEESVLDILSAERQRHELEMRKLEDQLVLKRERQRMAEERKMLQRELDLKVKPAESQLDEIESNISSTEGDSPPTERPNNAPKMSDNEESSSLTQALHQMLNVSRTQQQYLVETMQMPKCEIMKFDGDPLKYWPFIRTFKNTVDKKGTDPGQKLACLMQYCTGSVNRLLQYCLVSEPQRGYQLALELLEERFGNNFVIAQEWVRKITKGPQVKGKAELRVYADELRCAQETLVAMGQEEELNNSHQLLAIVEKLPQHLKTRWLRENHSIRERNRRQANLTDIVRFVDKAAEEVSDPVFGSIAPEDRSTKRSDKGVPRSFLVHTVDHNMVRSTHDSKKCPCCEESHPIWKCHKFKTLSVKERFAHVRQKGLCANCFGKGHFAKDCRKPLVCDVNGCGRKHSKFLHLPDGKGNESARSTSIPQSTYAPRSQAATSQETCSKKTSNFADSCGGKIAMPIVPVRVRCMDSERYLDTYAMLDPGTNASYCTEELRKSLGAKGKVHQTELTTITQNRMPIKSTLITLLVSDMDEREEPKKITNVTVRPCLNIDLSGLANRCDLDQWHHLSDIVIPEVNADQVHLLIGQDCSDLLVPLDIRKGQLGEPFAIRTFLGWAVNGPVNPFEPAAKASHFVYKETSLQKDLSKMWEIEGVHSEDHGMSPSDMKTLDIWEKTRTIVDDHYIMSIPFKEESPCLMNNLTMAEKRLKLLGKRLNKDENLKMKYTNEIQKLLKNGYAEEVPQEDLTRADGKVWYLPHHPVFNPRKPEKCRVVFDCAAKYGGLSLNDHIHQGPDLANKLVGVLLRFREGPVAFMADIEAMFHQVRVSVSDRDILRFLWFQQNDTEKPPKAYRMTSHLFGGVWSPSCANHALQQVTREFQEEYSQCVLDTVLHNFYVDDCLKSVDTPESAIPLAKNVRELLARRGFRLTKFVSNSPELLNTIPKEEWGKSFTTLDVSLDKLPTEHALGMLWDIETDSFLFDVQVAEKPKTKRGVLSILSTVYDSLGCVGPFVLQARRLFQQLCRLQKDWDEPLPKELEQQWGRWLNDLPVIKNFKIPRCLVPHDKPLKSAQLHHFSDASEYGYGAVAYLFMTFADGTVSTQLMMAKSRLAPLKGSIIPRLELAGALKVVRLNKLLQREFKIPLEESVFWTDSTNVLWYLQSSGKRFQTYVANRLAKNLCSGGHLN